ncbi:MAG: LiaF-related protein, partial [Nocardioides sp.]|nr:LiaF-related protein [Nocardioides sp.]
GAYWFPWPIAVLALGVLWFVQRDRRTRTWTPYAGPAPTAGASGTPPGTPSGTAPADLGQPYPHAHTAPGVPIPPIDYSRLRPQNPRKRGPVLFWFTLALIALAEGTLLVVDLAGVDVLASAYPALALAIAAGMLVLGAFWGRAGGLILVALLAAGATWATAASEQWESQTLRYAPQQASEVRDTYELHGGQLVLDLSQVEDPEALAGREVRVDAGAGQVEVIVPTGLDVLANTDVGVGSLTVFGDQTEGLGINRTGSHTGDDSTVDLTVDIDLGAGEVVVRTQGGTR